MQSESATGPSGSAFQTNNETHKTHKTTKLEDNEELQESENENTDRDGAASNTFSISIDVGDVSPEEVTVKVKKGTLSISGQHMENKGKGFSFHGFTEEYAIPPSIDSKTLVATILDGKTMKIEGYRRAILPDNTCQINSSEGVADAKKTQQSRKRSFPISERSSFNSCHDVTTFPSPGSRKSSTCTRDCAKDKCCSSTICRCQGFPVLSNSKTHCNVTKPSSDEHTDGPTPSKKRKTGKMPLTASCGSSTTGVKSKTNRSLTPPPHVNRSTPPPARAKHSVVSPTPIDRSGERSFMPISWSSWAKSDFEPFTPTSTSNISKPSPPQ